MKLNVGCGMDYREGFVNIDGSSSLPRVDKIIDLSRDSLVSMFGAHCCEFILANDILEHQFHWEAQRLLSEFWTLLTPAGNLEIRVPDCEHIMLCTDLTVEQKLTWLFGGQDVSQGHDHVMDASRKQCPQYFCHKYGWSRVRMNAELSRIGFARIAFVQQGHNLIATAGKP